MDDLVVVLRRGGVVCLPTDTTYGLVSSASDGGAVERVYRLKGRSRNKPLVCLIGDSDWVNRYCEPRGERWLSLAERWWPGPLNLVLPVSRAMPKAPLSGGASVALRVPAHALLLQLLRALEEPLVAPSANPAGEPPALSANEARRYFGHRVDCYHDGGTSDSAMVSTIVDLTTEPSRVLREGRIPLAELRGLPGFSRLTSA